MWNTLQILITLSSTHFWLFFSSIFRSLQWLYTSALFTLNKGLNYPGEKTYQAAFFTPSRPYRVIHRVEWSKRVKVKDIPSDLKSNSHSCLSVYRWMPHKSIPQRQSTPSASVSFLIHG